jgi:facilitated trehalose transporter
LKLYLFIFSASIIGIALIAGNLIMTPMMNSIGRKKSHILTTLPILTGWFVAVLADSVTALIMARILQGISMGMLGPLGSIIVAEMTDPKNRGAFLTCISLSLTIGVLFCHTLGTYVTWQTLAFTCSFITFISLLLIIYSPETPPWLISKGRYEEATEVFHWLRGQGPEQDLELESMIRAQQLLRKSSLDEHEPLCTRIRHGLRYFSRTIRKPEFFKPVFIMFFLYALFQFSGLNVIASYAMDIITQVVGPDANATLLMVALDVERLICNIFAVFVMRKFKRRTVLFTTGFICVISYIAKGTYVYAKQNNMMPIQGQWLPITLIGLYMFSLTIGISSVPFTISGEIIPLEYRGLGAGISTLPLSLNFFIAVKCFPVLTSAIGLSYTYFIYGGVVTVCLSFLYFLLPETKDRTLQEIEDEFRGVSALDRRVTERLNGKISSSINEMRRCSSHILY